MTSATASGTAELAPELVLYYTVGACSRIPLIALEEAQASYQTKCIDMIKGEHKSEAYLAVNPKGKIPALMVDGRLLTENVAILGFLNRLFPYARLLPVSTDAWSDAEAVSVLAWCGTTLHPLVTRIRAPSRFCDMAGTAERISEMGRADMAVQLAVAEKRLASRTWMLGEEWSVADAYIWWIWSRGTEAPFDQSRFPNLIAHHARMNERPSVQRALAREAA